MTHKTTIAIPSGGEHDITSLLQVPAGTELDVRALGPSPGPLVNESTVIVAGALKIDAALSQPGNMGNNQIDVINGGHVSLSGATDGGGIGITKGTLEFTRSPSFIHQPESASENFNSWLAFGGASGTLQFDGIKGPVAADFDPVRNNLVVTDRTGASVGDFHLAASQQPYSQGEFSVQKNQVLFHHIAQT